MSSPQPDPIPGLVLERFRDKPRPCLRSLALFHSIDVAVIDAGHAAPGAAEVVQCRLHHMRREAKPGQAGRGGPATVLDRERRDFYRIGARRQILIRGLIPQLVEFILVPVEAGNRVKLLWSGAAKTILRARDGTGPLMLRHTGNRGLLRKSPSRLAVLSGESLAKP